MLIRQLKASVERYIAFNPDSHKYQGHKNADIFIDYLEYLKEKAEKKFPLTIESLYCHELSLIQEIQNFALRQENYSESKKTLSANNSLCLGYIERALDIFIKQYGNNLKSKILSNFVEYLSSGKRTAIYTNPQNSQEKIEVRRRLRALSTARLI